LKTGQKIQKVVEGVDQIKRFIYDATGDSGTIKIQGRQLHYKVKGQMYKWKYQYNGVAWDEEGDEEAKVSVKSKGWQSAGGAREHALEDLVAELIKLGHLKQESKKDL